MKLVELGQTPFLVFSHYWVAIDEIVEIDTDHEGLIKITTLHEVYELGVEDSEQAAEFLSDKSNSWREA